MYYFVFRNTDKYYIFIFTIALLRNYYLFIKTKNIIFSIAYIMSIVVLSQIWLKNKDICHLIF